MTGNSVKDCTKLTRRGALKTAILGGAALAAPQMMVRPAQAKAPMLGAMVPQFYRFTLGDFEITTLNDGLRPGDGPHPTFGADQPAVASRGNSRSTVDITPAALTMRGARSSSPPARSWPASRSRSPTSAPTSPA